MKAKLLAAAQIFCLPVSESLLGLRLTPGAPHAGLRLPYAIAKRSIYKKKREPRGSRFQLRFRLNITALTYLSLVRGEESIVTLLRGSGT